MFDSLRGGYLPICLAVVIAAWFLRVVRSGWLRWMAAFVVPVAISLAWYFIPAVVRGFSGDLAREGEVAWGYISAATWCMVAVPLSAAAVFLFGVIRNRRPRTAASARPPASSHM
jgi:hypothetical protein